MKICYIANYGPDRQESMNRFASWLDRTMRDKGLEAEIIRPKVIMIYLVGGKTPLAKWLGYLDKFVLFPLYLRWYSRLRRNKGMLYHVVDHSNALYANCLPPDRTLLTCHDVLAIRGGLGDSEAYCKASSTGKILQRWILKHLQKCPHIVFVSEATHDDYCNLPSLGKRNVSQLRNVVYNGLNQPFCKIEEQEANVRLEQSNLSIKRPFFFHIGSSLPRKNRAGILYAFRKFLQHHPDYQMVFAGAQFSQNEQETIGNLSFQPNDVIHIGRVSHEVLNALYSLAEGFVFPSFSEGFGWPVIEAQSCGCPVIYGNRTSLPEIAGEGGIACDPASHESICSAFLHLTDSKTRARLTQKGYFNTERFDPQVTSDRYLELYRNKYSHEIITKRI